MQSEVSCVVPPDRITRDQASGTVTASLSQLQALAHRLRLPSVAMFRFTYTFRPTSWSGIYRLQGHLDAQLEQECVLTLEPVPGTISTPFSCLCGTPSALKKLAEQTEPDPNEDPPEEITESGVDVGELAIQYLSLALHDYPRRTDVALPDLLQQIGHIQQENTDTPNRQQPFTPLKAFLRTSKE